MKGWRLPPHRRDYGLAPLSCRLPRKGGSDGENCEWNMDAQDEQDGSQS